MPSVDIKGGEGRTTLTEVLSIHCVVRAGVEKVAVMMVRVIQ